MRSWRWTSLRLPRKSSYCSKGAPQSQKSKPELCPYVRYDRCIRLPVFFSYFFCQPFVYSVLVPSLQLLWRQGDWMKTSLCQSLFDCIYPFSPFHVVGRPLPGTSRNMTEVGCVILMSKKVFSQLFHSPLAEISNRALSAALPFLS